MVRFYYDPRYRPDGSTRRKSGAILILCLALTFGVTNKICQFFADTAFPQNEFDDESIFPFVAAFIGGQFVVPLLWCAFSRSNMLWRLTVFGLAATLILLPPLFANVDGHWLVAFELWLPVLLAGYIPLALYRFIGKWEIAYYAEKPAAGGRQLSIADMATLTFFTALVFATQLHYQDSILPNQMFAGLPMLIMWVLAVAVLVVTTLSLPLLCLLMPHPSRRRIVISCITPAVAIAAGFSQLDFSSIPWTEALQHVASFAIPLLVIIVTSLLMLSRMGFRLEKPTGPTGIGPN